MKNIDNLTYVIGLVLIVSSTVVFGSNDRKPPELKKMYDPGPGKAKLPYVSLKNFSEEVTREAQSRFYRLNRLREGESQVVRSYDNCQEMAKYTVRILKKLISSSRLASVLESEINLYYPCYSYHVLSLTAQINSGVIHLEPGYLYHAESEDQYASLLAHELGHYLLKHNYIGRVGTKKNNVKENHVLRFMGIGTSARSFLERELEADQIATLLLFNADYNPKETLENLKNLVQKQGINPEEKRHLMAISPRLEKIREGLQVFSPAILKKTTTDIPLEVRGTVEGYFDGTDKGDRDVLGNEVFERLMHRVSNR